MLVAFQKDLTMEEPIKKFGVHANQTSDLKNQLLSGAPYVFGKGVLKAENVEQTVHVLQARVDGKTSRRDFRIDPLVLSFLDLVASGVHQKVPKQR